jgi:hypothetical protein
MLMYVSLLYRQERNFCFSQLAWPPSISGHCCRNRYTCSWNMGRRSNHLSLSLTHAAIHAFCAALHNRHLEVARLVSLSQLQFCSKLGVRLSACAWPPRTWSAPVLRSRSSSCLPSRRQQQLRRRLSVGTARPLAS